MRKRTRGSVRGCEGRARGQSATQTADAHTRRRRAAIPRNRGLRAHATECQQRNGPCGKGQRVGSAPHAPKCAGGPRRPRSAPPAHTVRRPLQRTRMHACMHARTRVGLRVMSSGGNPRTIRSAQQSAGLQALRLARGLRKCSSCRVLRHRAGQGVFWAEPSRLPVLP